MLHVDGAVTDLEPLLGLDVDVFKSDVEDWRLGKADDDPGPVAVGGLYILDADVVEVGGEPGDGSGGDFAFGHDLGVVLADENGGADILHEDVLEAEVGDVGAAVAVGFDADALVGAFEADVFRMHALYASGDFAADGETVAGFELAVGDGDVGGWGVGTGGVDGAGFDGDVVVADGGEVVVDGDVG